VEDVDKSTRIS